MNRAIIVSKDNLRVVGVSELLDGYIEKQYISELVNSGYSVNIEVTDMSDLGYEAKINKKLAEYIQKYTDIKLNKNLTDIIAVRCIVGPYRKIDIIHMLNSRGVELLHKAGYAEIHSKELSVSEIEGIINTAIKGKFKGETLIVKGSDNNIVKLNSKYITYTVK